ncbi:MAG: NUDIX domain-containing protein [bacterium]
MKPISRKAVILPYNDDNQILIQDRSNIKKTINIPWGYFGGGIEAGETPVMALIREVKEELELTINEKDLKFIGIYTDQPIPEKKIIRHAFLWKINIPISELKLHEGKRMKLVASDKVADYMILEADKELAIAANKILNTLVS